MRNNDDWALAAAPRLLASLMSHITPEPNSGCWLWTGKTNALGYARRLVGNDVSGGIKVRRYSYVHRVIYLAHRGPIAPGLVLDHKCRVPSCCNPDHLDPVSQKENILRGLAPAASNILKTHCKRGHEFTPENTRVQYHSGGRYKLRHCISCQGLRRGK